MAVKTGQLTSFTFNSNDIAADLLTMQLSSPNGMIDVSGLDLVGFQRIIGRRDAKVQLTFRISDTAAKAHATLSPATSTSISASCVIVFGGKTFTFHAIAENYDVNIGNGLDAVGSCTLSMDTGVAGVWS
jgi:hypothetical protein